MIRWAAAVIWVQVLVVAFIAFLALPFASLAWFIASSVTTRDVGSCFTWWMVLTLLLRSLPLLTDDH